MTDQDLVNTVYIKRLSEYDRDAVCEIATEGMREFGFKPSGNVFVKPNVVVAHKPELLGNKACTKSEVIGGSMLALADSPGVARVDLGENSSVGFPTRMCYKYAGYYDEIAAIRKRAKSRVDLFCIDEEPRDRVFIGGMVHDTLRVSRKMARADAKVYLPRLKCHCVSNMTATIKLNVGICSDDERSIRHDFLLNDKIVDLLSAGYPDFVIMDAVDVGVGNEGFPTLRKLGLMVMGRNPVAVDMVGARLLGMTPEDVPYLKRAIERGYGPSSIDQVKIAGDLHSLQDVDAQAERVKPHDHEFYRWQDVHKELERLQSPIRFFWGPYRENGSEKCLTGCVMGLKMFLASFEQYAGAEAFAKARPSVIVIGNCKDKEIDAAGNNVFMFGSCAKANIKNARKIKKIDKCYTTVTDMTIQCGAGLGLPAPILDPAFVLPFARGMTGASLRKLVKMRYAQDVVHFLTKSLERRI